MRWKSVSADSDTPWFLCSLKLICHPESRAFYGSKDLNWQSVLDLQSSPILVGWAQNDSSTALAKFSVTRMGDKGVVPGPETG
jgi:hypothetical protein